MEKVRLVFIPAPGSGHLVSTLQFAKRLIDQEERISITILAIQSAFPTTLTQNLNPPAQDSFNSPAKSFSLYIESHLPNVKKIVTSLVSSSHASKSLDSIRVAGLVVDFFCVSMVDVAKELHLPTYLFMTSNAGYLALMLHLPIRHKHNEVEPKDSDPEWLIPGIVHPVPPRVLPVALTDGSYSAYVKVASRFRETRGIIANTVVELETYAINSFFHDGQTPPVYPVGPVIDLEDCQSHSNLEQAQRDKIIRWLDDSVLCCVFMFWQHGELWRRASERDSCWA
ncbi:hypothetical protein ACE6H2_019278 [Prunus campanulata]